MMPKLRLFCYNLRNFEHHMEILRAEQYRDYLRLLARLQIAPALASKIDVSGIVQQTIWEATQTPPAGMDDREWLKWLRRLLANNLRDEIRKLKAARRDVRRERSLQEALDASSTHLEGWLRSQQSTPSQRAIRAEELNRLATALSDLPDDQLHAIELHHLRGLPLQAVAEQIGRSKEAVASLLYRAMKNLKTQLAPDPE